MFKSSNPAMKPFADPQKWGDLTGSSAVDKPTTMTYGGVAQATGIQLGCAVLGAAGGWSLVQKGIIAGGLSIGLLLGIFAVLFILGMIMRGKPKLAIVLGPIASVVYGLLAGIISYVIAFAMGGVLMQNAELLGAAEGATRADVIAKGSGIVFQAMMLTLGVVGAMAIATATGLISVRGTFAKVVMFATGAIMLTYMVGWILSMFGTGIPMIHEVGPIGIAFSGVVVVVASLNLAMEFAMVQDGVRAGAPKHMEWYAGYAIISTVIWLYIEILILLYKIYAMTSRN